MTIQEWQRILRDGPVVWALADEEGVIELYDSAEAVATAERWYRAHGERGIRSYQMHIHTLELARVRWEEGFAAEPPAREGEEP